VQRREDVCGDDVTDGRYEEDVYSEHSVILMAGDFCDTFHVIVIYVSSGKSALLGTRRFVLRCALLSFLMAVTSEYATLSKLHEQTI